MNLCAIICSPRFNGNTSCLIHEAVKSAKIKGATVNLFYVHEKKLLPCTGCKSCWESNKCCLNDDMHQIHDAMISADGIILGSPVYFWSISSQAKCIIDRSYAFYSNKLLKDKKIGFITIASKRGNTSAISVMTSFALLQQMKIIGCVTAYGTERQDVKSDAKAINEARLLGEQMTNYINK